MAICGVGVTKDGRTVQSMELARMLSRLSLNPNWVRISDVDSQAGVGATSPQDGPSITSSDDFLVVCDADLYNLEELRNSLDGSRRTSNLASLLAALYQELGTKFIQRLRGAFALAIWDKKKNSFLLAVDRFRIKPLCYSVTENELIFASQPGAVFAGGRLQKKVNRAAIAEYLNFSMVPAPHCAFDDVTKLMPGSYLLWENGSSKTVRYWEMTYPENADASADELAQQLLGHMKEAVSVTSEDLTSAQVGCFLSGGTDSSSITGLLTEIKKSAVHTFSIGFSEQQFNELEYAHIAAKHYHSDHAEHFVGPDETYDTIPKIVAAYDEPFGNPSVIPTYLCQVLARQRGVNFMLAGDGGDELFGGNQRYATEQMFLFYQRFPEALRRKLIEPLVLGFPSSAGVFGKAQRYIRRSNQGNPERYCQWHLLQHFPPDQVLSPEMFSNNGSTDFLSVPRALHRAAPAHSELNRLLYIDAHMTLADNDLPKVVRASEMAGVTVRFPYLDHVLAEFSGKLPIDLKVRWLEKRYLFKRATRNLLPQEILKKKKHGFGLPIGGWLRTIPKLRRMTEEVLFDARTYQRGYFKRTFIEQMFREMDQDTTTYMGDLLWLFLMLELWHRGHVEGSAV